MPAIATPPIANSLVETVAPSLAVLPLTNLSSDTEQQYVADGLTEDLISALSKLPGYSVIAAQTSSMQAVAALGVRYVIVGSLRRFGEGYRVWLQLTEVPSVRVIWADHIDSSFDSVHILPGRIAAKTAETLGVSAPLRDHHKITIAPEAFDLCMRGRAAWRLSDDDEIRARSLFERAVEIDPRYAEPYPYMAESDFMSWAIFGGAEHLYRDRAVANARTAVRLDPQSADAISMLALILMYERQWKEAEEAFRCKRWAETQPYTDLATRDRFLNAYRPAGLPD